MRLWSLPTNWLDSKGLVACWREGLLALNVLQGKTRGYKNHPQLDRFKKHSDPIQAISNYLWTLANEADIRGYKFDKTKIPNQWKDVSKISLNSKQLDYEFQFLRSKVLFRNPLEWRWGTWNMTNHYNSKVFNLVYGEIEDWEKIKEI